MPIKETITIAGKSKHPLKVNRFGYGTMRLTGEGIYGEPKNRPEALQILKRAVESGINFIDTADYYGEDVTNRLIAEALYPYPADLVICTKVGGARKPDKSWIPFNTPEKLRASIDNNLRTLKLEQITLVHFRYFGAHATVPFEESLGAMFEMQKEGKILHVGVSNVTLNEVKTAMKMGPIATIENMYGHAQRTTANLGYGPTPGGGEVLELCEQNEIPLIPYFSLLTSLGKDERIPTIAKKHKITEAQANLAWLLHKSPWILPIPGTSKLKHFEENLKSVDVKLTKEDMKFLE